MNEDDAELDMHSTEKTCDTILADENALQHVTSVLVLALCNQPKAFASELGDNQSRYLLSTFVNLLIKWNKLTSTLHQCTCC